MRTSASEVGLFCVGSPCSMLGAGMARGFTGRGGQVAGMRSGSMACGCDERADQAGVCWGGEPVWYGHGEYQVAAGQVAGQCGLN